MHARFEQMGGIGMPEGMDGHACFGDSSPVFGLAAGALDTGAPHGRGGRRAWFLIPPSGGKEPGLVPMGFPGGAEQRERIGGQGDVPVFGPLAAVDMDLEALAIKVGDLQEEGFLEPETQAVDGGEGDLGVHGGSRREEPPDLLHTEDSWKPVRSLRAQEREGVPVALEDVLGEEANTARADTHGGWGEAIDVFAVQDIALQRLFGDAVGGLVVELGQQVDCSDIGCLCPFAFATEVERRQHVLTPWGHEISPCVR